MLLREMITEWVCGDCYAEPCTCSVEEGVTTIFGKSGNKTVRKYRCTSGTRKGRIVAKMSTCTAPKSVKKATTLKKVKRAGAKRQAVKIARTKRPTQQPTTESIWPGGMREAIKSAARPGGAEQGVLDRKQNRRNLKAIICIRYLQISKSESLAPPIIPPGGQRIPPGRPKWIARNAFFSIKISIIF